MRILLVQLPTSHHGSMEKVYPLGLSRLSSLLPSGFERASLDMNLYQDPWPVLKETILDFLPDSVALSFRNIDPLGGHRSSYLSSLKAAAGLTRRLLPKARIIAGGPAFSLFAESLMKMVEDLDAGLIGEAEDAFLSLLEGGRPGGAVTRSGSKISVRPKKKMVDITRLPPPDFSLFPPMNYRNRNSYVAAFGIEGKRGCDLGCGYCVYPLLGGRRVRLRPPVQVAYEMQAFYDACGCDLFHFTDPVINRPPGHFEEICNEIVRLKMKFRWTGFFREDVMSGRQLDLAQKSGLVAVYLSGDAVEAKDNLQRLLDIHSEAGNLGAVIFNNIRLYPGAPITRSLIRRGELDASVSLVYPVYYDPVETGCRRYELEELFFKSNLVDRLVNAT